MVEETMPFFSINSMFRKCRYGGKYLTSTTIMRRLRLWDGEINQPLVAMVK